MERDERHETILGIIREQTISSQEQLRDELAEHGVAVTQATLSRDLKELRIAKVEFGDEGYYYALLDRTQESAIESIEKSGNLLLLRVGRGLGPAIAHSVEELQLTGVLGAVADQDKVLVVLGEDSSSERIKREIWQKARIC